MQRNRAFFEKQCNPLFPRAVLCFISRPFSACLLRPLGQGDRAESKSVGTFYQDSKAFAQALPLYLPIGKRLQRRHGIHICKLKRVLHRKEQQCIRIRPDHCAAAHIARKRTQGREVRLWKNDRVPAPRAMPQRHDVMGMRAEKRDLRAHALRAQERLIRNEEQQRIHAGQRIHAKGDGAAYARLRGGIIHGAKAAPPRRRKHRFRMRHNGNARKRLSRDARKGMRIQRRPLEFGKKLIPAKALPSACRH